MCIPAVLPLRHFNRSNSNEPKLLLQLLTETHVLGFKALKEVANLREKIVNHFNVTVIKLRSGRSNDSRVLGDGHILTNQRRQFVAEILEDVVKDDCLGFGKGDRVHLASFSADIKFGGTLGIRTLYLSIMSRVLLTK